MPLKRVSGPAAEPFTLAEARLHLKETTPGADIDAKINRVIQAVRELCENDCRRAFMTQQWEMTLATFPAPDMSVGAANWYGPMYGTAPGPIAGLGLPSRTGYEIYLPLPPLQSIDSITYADQSGTPVSMNVGTDLIVNNVVEPAVVLPAIGTSWPAASATGLTITFTCGFGPNPSDVPACAVMWMMAMMGAIYSMPAAEMAVYRESLIVPAFVDRLLDPVRYRRY